MLFFITVSVLVVSANAKFYRNCDTGHATVHNVSVSGCADDAEECVLTRNTKVTFNIDFTPQKEVTDVDWLSLTTTSVNRGFFGRSFSPLNLPLTMSLLPDGCKESDDSDCPLPAGQLTSQTVTAGVSRLHFLGKADLKWSLEDENKEHIYCVIISVLIQ